LTEDGLRKIRNISKENMYSFSKAFLSVDETVKSIPILCSKVYQEQLWENQLSNSKAA